MTTNDSANASGDSSKLLGELEHISRAHWNDCTGDVAHEAAARIRELTGAIVAMRGRAIQHANDPNSVIDRARRIIEIADAALAAQPSTPAEDGKV